ncbi:hypothetical protein BJX61DRAFT_534034 [Aspergillus egyptiacus]|nr:hypothetical protein BJX61DRAFT_534034 [Aspergillus egyptiacus]
MRAMESITDKPEWIRKVFDEEITAKWTQELLSSGQDITPKMANWIIKELQWKAETVPKTGNVEAFDVGVVKSDSAVSEELKVALRNAVAPLENVPVEERDYHPGSDMKVVDLVHPSLFPVMYGRTRILPDRTIGIEDCLRSIGEGEVLPVAPEEETKFYIPEGTFIYGSRRWGMVSKPYSRKFQWLPCDVEFTEDGGCRIVSYINNLHPVKHKALYEVIEKILTQTIPLWDTSLTRALSKPSNRIDYTEVEYLENPQPEPTMAEGEDEDEFDDRYREWEHSCPIKKPEPGRFSADIFGCPEEPVVLCEQFRDDGLQVIIKLANIELTPDKPDYDGGSWHIEGQLNERICATAIYYYDSQNITESRLAFRQRIDTGAIEEDVSYEQNRHEFLNQIFGVQDNQGYPDHVTQELGSVVTHEGRLLTFPNILQHRVAPFSLADRTKPGHRKILAFFLIDPHLRKISSANVPPQQEEWVREQREVRERLLAERLPVELREMVKEYIPNASMTLDETKAYRLELMEERRVHSVANNQQFEGGEFSLCEH